MSPDKSMGLSSVLSSRGVALPSSKPLRQLIIALRLHAWSIGGGLLGLGQKPFRHLQALLSGCWGAQAAIASSGIRAGRLPVSPAWHVFALPRSPLPLASIPMASRLHSPTCSLFWRCNWNLCSTFTSY